MIQLNPAPFEAKVLQLVLSFSTGSKEVESSTALLLSKPTGVNILHVKIVFNI